MLNLNLKTLVAAAAVSLLAAAPALADDYPSRDFTLVVTSSAGGGSDIIARTVANIIAKKNLIPTNVMVENRPGGSSVVGNTYVAGRAGNPYFWATISGSFFTTSLAGASTVSYKDFTPLAAIAEDPFVIVVRADAGINDMKQLIAMGHANVGSTGVLTDHALLAKRLEAETGLKTNVVPFDGDGEVLAAILGGHIDVQIGNPSEIMAQVEAGRLKALAVTTKDRVSALPDVPTLTEQGINIQHGQLRAFVMPKDLKPEEVAYAENVFRQVAESPEWKTDYLEKNHANAVFLDSKTLGERFVQINGMYEKFMKENGLMP